MKNRLTTIDIEENGETKKMIILCTTRNERKKYTKFGDWIFIDHRLLFTDWIYYIVCIIVAKRESPPKTTFIPCKLNP